MSFFDRFRRTEKRTVTSITGGSNPYDDGWAVGSTDAPSESHPAVQACVSAIAGTISTLPASIKRRDEDGRLLEVPDHPLNAWISNGPNEREAWSDFVESLIGDALLRGNGLAEIVVESATGAAVALRYIPWSHVSPSQTASGRLVFDFAPPAIGGAASTAQRRLLPGEYLHLKDRSDDGILGISRLRRASAAATNANLTDMHLAAMIRNGGGRPGSILKSEKELDDGAIERLQVGLDRFRSPDGRGKTMVLEDGLEFQEVEAFSPSDMEMVESLKFHVVNISRIFGVPPVMISALENASYSNAGQLTRFFAQGTLSHWVSKVEAAFNRAVFTEGERGDYCLDISLDGLLRGDPETRWEAWKIAAEIGAADPAYIAKMEGYSTPSGPKPVTPSPARSEEGVQ